MLLCGFLRAPGWPLWDTGCWIDGPSWCDPVRISFETEEWPLHAQRARRGHLIVPDAGDVLYNGEDNSTAFLTASDLIGHCIKQEAELFS